MQKKGLTVILLIVAALLLISCSTIRVDKPSVIETDYTKTAEFSKSLLDAAEFLSNGTTITSSDITTLPSADDEVYVTVRLGSGIVESFFNSGYATVADYALSLQGAALIESYEAQQDEVIELMRESKLTTEIKHRYNILQNGFAARVKFGDIAKIKALTGVDQVVVSEEYAVPETTSEAIAASFAGTGIFNNATGNGGAGTVIAIIDTGVDVAHSAFATDPSVQALDYENLANVFEATNAAQRGATLESVYFSGKIPFGFNYSDANDQVGPDFSDIFVGHEHGTHVAGIAAGNNDVIKGAGYDAQLAVMRVFGAGSGGAYDVDIYAAIEDCIILNVQVANLSLGSACGFAYEKDEERAFVNEIVRLASKTGLTMCCATGNDGTAWWFSDTLDPFSSVDDPDNGVISSPASYDGTFAIGSAQNLVKIYIDFNGERLIGRNSVPDSDSRRENDFYALLEGKDEATFDYVVVPNIGNPEDYEGIDVTGKIALVQRGEISFAEKVQNAADKGAIAVILYDNETQLIEQFGAVVGENTIPTMTLTLADGKKLVNAAEKKVTINASNYTVDYSVFSSMGALNDLTIGVDILGIGGQVYSSVPECYDWANGTEGYDTFDGTSMATPNVSGVMAALKGYLMEKYPDRTGAQISAMAMQRLMSTAILLENAAGNPITPRRQGSGLADVQRAMDTDAYLTVTGSDRTKLNLGSDINKDGIYTLNFNLVNDGETAHSYKLGTLTFTESAVTGKSINYTTKGADKLFIAEKAYMFNDVEIRYFVDGKLINGDEITVDAGEKVKIKAVVTLTEENKAYMDATFPNGIYVEGYATLEDTDECGIDLHIPWISFYGDWQTLPAFEPTAFDGENPTWGNYFGLSMVVFGEDNGSGFVSGTMFSAGKYSFMLPEGYKAPEAKAEKTAIGRGYTEDGSLVSNSAILDSLTLAIKRNASAIYIDYVKADTGEILGHDSFFNIGKSAMATNGGYTLGFGTFTPEALMFANNEQLIFSFTYDFNDEPVGQTVDMPVFVDLEAPTLEKAEWRIEGGRTYLDLTVFDNHYLQATGLLTYGTESSYSSLYKFMLPCYSDVMNGSYSYTIDVTDHLANVVNNTFAVQLVDYARNTSVFEIKLPEAGENGTDALVNETENGRTLAVKYSTGNLTVLYDVNDPSYTEVRTRLSSDMLGNNDSYVPAEADEDAPEFVIENGVLTAYNGEGGEVIVPDGVKAIGSNVFTKDPTITKIVLPEGLTTIGANSINVLKNLTELVLPSTLERLEFNSLHTLTSLKTLDLEHTNLNYIGSALNALTSIKEITFPKTETPLTMDFGLAICYNLEKVTFLGDIENMMSSVMFNDALKEVEFNGKVNKLDDESTGFSMSLTSCDKLERIVFHESVGTIGCHTETDFGDGFIQVNDSKALSTLPSLKEVVFEKDVECITGYSFASCAKLESVVFCGNLGSLGTQAFGGSDLLVNGFTVAEGNDKLIKDESGIVYNLEKTVMFKPSAWDYDGVLELPETITKLNKREFSIPLMVPVGSEQDYGVDPDDGFYWSLGSTFRSPDYYKTRLKGVKLGSQITELPEYCFYRNYNLEEINLDNITSFGSGSLAFTAIDSIVISDKVTTVGTAVWEGCRNLTELVLSDTAEYLSYQSFYAGTGFTEIVVPEAITADNMFLFNGCENLEKVTFLNTESTSVGDYAFIDTRALKEIIGLENVERIGSSAFQESGITSAIFPKVTVLGTSAFQSADKLEVAEFENLETVEIGWLGFAWTFKDCTSLRSFTISEKLGNISVSDVFSGCIALEEINAHENNAYFASEDGVLFNKEMTNIILYPTASENVEFDIPETVSVIGEGVFANAKNLRKITMPSVTVVDASAFENSGLTEVVVDALVEIGANAFANTPLETIDLRKVEVIDDKAFFETKLTEIVLENAYYVGNKTFGNVETLTKVVLGDVGEFNFSRTFFNSKNIGEIELVGCEAFVLENDFLYNADKTVVYRYVGSEENVTVAEGVVKVDAEAFANIATLKSVVLPETLVSIGDSAFYGCTALTEITFKSEKAPTLQSYFREDVRYLYNQFVNDIETAEGNENVTVYVSDNASYNTYIWKLYFKNIIVK